MNTDIMIDGKNVMKKSGGNIEVIQKGLKDFIMKI